MGFNWKQLAIAIGLFLLGYLTFNNPWSGDAKKTESAIPAPASSSPSPVPAPAQDKATAKPASTT